MLQHLVCINDEKNQDLTFKFITVQTEQGPVKNMDEEEDGEYNTIVEGNKDESHQMDPL